MKDENQTTVMAIPIQNLNFSDAFKEKSKSMGFRTLTEITETAPEALIKNEGFDYNWFGELVTFLIDKKMLYKLQPTPGNNPG